MERGSWPAGAFSGISWTLMDWWSLYVERPYSVSRGLPSSSYSNKDKVRKCYTLSSQSIDLCRVDSTGREWFQGSQVSVLSL